MNNMNILKSLTHKPKIKNVDNFGYKNSHYKY